MINNVETLSGDYLLCKMNTFMVLLFRSFPTKAISFTLECEAKQPANCVGEDSKSIILMHLLFGSFQVLNLEFPVNTTKKRILRLYYKK